MTANELWHGFVAFNDFFATGSMPPTVISSPGF